MKISYLTKNILLGFIVLVVILLLTFIIAPLAKYSIYVWLTLFIALGFVFSIIKKRTNNFISGFVGEDDISYELKNLPKEFIIINDFYTGRGNIDKIVVGPTGIWTLEVKSYKGNIIPREHDLKQAYAEAKTLEEIINTKLNMIVSVQPVLVFSDKFAKVRFGLNKQRGVYVIQKAWLTKLIRETHIQNLDNETILRIKEVL